MATSHLQYDMNPDVVDASAAHTATVIMLHGLGDTSDGWAPVGFAMRAQVPHVKWIFPTAPRRPITCNGGMYMTGWYDIPELADIDSREDAAGVLDSCRYIKELIAKEVAAGVPENRIVLGGFSQGGAVALMLMRDNLRLAGIMALSTYLPLRSQQPVVSDAGKDIPLFMAHGLYDNVIALPLGEKSKELLADAGVGVTWRTYPMAHSACDEEFQEMARFLTRVLP